MLIIYPDTNWDSFCSITDATTILTNNIRDISTWTALTDTDKEKILRQSTMLIDLQIQKPTTLEDNLKKACAYLANHSIENDMLNSTSDSNVKKEKIAGAIETEYFSPNKDSNSFPDIVNLLIQNYSPTTSTSGAFVFERA